VTIFRFRVFMENMIFVKISKNLAKQRSENNYVWTIKIIMQDAQTGRMSKLFTTMLIMLENFKISI